MKEWVKINTKLDFSTYKEQSPIIKCLLYDREDMSFFKSQLKIGCKNINEGELEERIKRIIEWRKLLDDKLGNKQDLRDLCVFSLGHLIAARYSGKAQSLDAIGYTLNKLSNAMADEKAIIFTFCFGGYKSHTSPSHPEVDWAELFNLNYLVCYLYPLFKNYKYGIEIEYESEEVSIQFNNVPQKKTDRYTASFLKLIEYYKNKLSEKYDIDIPIRLVVARDLYKGGVTELYRLIDRKKEEYREIFESLPNSEQDKWIKRAKSNYMWEDGIIKYGEISDDEKNKIYKEARITNEAFLDADYILREEWFENPYRIPLTGTWGTMPSAQPIDGWLHIKSTEYSKVDCWIGTGFLEAKVKDDKVQYRQTILSKNQMESMVDRIQYIENDDELLKRVSENFNKIPIFYREEEAI